MDNIEQGYIQVTFATDNYSRPIIKSFPIDSLYIKDYLRPLDLPSPGSDVFTKVLCTPERTIKTTKLSREKFSITLSRLISEAIVEALSKNDTENGYPIEFASPSEPRPKSGP